MQKVVLGLFFVGLMACDQSWSGSGHLDESGPSEIASRSPAVKYHDLWIFGDSFSDTGATTEILPLLKAMGAPPLPANGKLSDGKIWIEYFAELLGFPERSATYWRDDSRNPGNFSMIAASSKRNQIAIADFPEQVDRFQADQAKFHPNDLIVVQMGINDALDAMKTYGRNVQNGKMEAIALGEKVIIEAMQSYEENFDRLIALGGRNFLVINGPDLGAAPFANQRKIPELATGFSLSLNKKIYEIFTRIKKKNPSLQFSFFDLFAHVRKMHADLAAYGLSAELDIKNPCGWRGQDGKNCISPEKFFYFDLNHPTSQVNSIIANEALKLLTSSEQGRN